MSPMSASVSRLSICYSFMLRVSPCPLQCDTPHLAALTVSDAAICSWRHQAIDIACALGTCFWLRRCGPSTHIREDPSLLAHMRHESADGPNREAAEGLEKGTLRAERVVIIGTCTVTTARPAHRS